MVVEIGILTAIICVSVLALAYIDTRQEKRLLDLIEEERRESEKKGG